MDYEFTFNGCLHTAAPAGWEQNGQPVWDIFDADEVFIDSVNVHPFSTIEATVTKWVEMELCFA
jgi:hypothetical protein